MYAFKSRSSPPERADSCCFWRERQTQRERPNLAGAPKLEPKLESILYGGSAQTRRSAGALKLCNSDDVSMRDLHCEVMLSERTRHTRVESIGFFVLDWIFLVGMVI